MGVVLGSLMASLVNSDDNASSHVDGRRVGQDEDVHDLPWALSGRGVLRALRVMVQSPLSDEVHFMLFLGLLAVSWVDACLRGKCPHEQGPEWVAEKQRAKAQASVGAQRAGSNST